MISQPHHPQAATAPQGRIRSVFSPREWLARAVAYLLLFLISFSMFTYIRFPASKLVPAMNEYLKGSGAEAEIGGASITFPPGLALNDISIKAKGAPGEHILNIPSAVIRPSILKALFGTMDADFHVELLGGTLDGLVSGKTGKNSASRLEFKLVDADAGQAQFWGGFPWFKAEGILEGDGAIDAMGMDPQTGEGTARLTLRSGRIIPSRSLTQDGSAIDLTRGELEVRISKGIVNILKGSMTGPEITMQISGGLNLDANIASSRLNLVATLSVAPSLKEKMPLLISLLPPAGQEGKHVIRIGGSLNSPLMK